MKIKISVPPPLTADEAVRRIAALQSDGAGSFPAGLFPSWRYHATLPYRRPDANVFCTAITVFTLQGIREKLGPEAQRLVDAMDDAGINPPYSCRSGACAACMCHLEEGDVELLHNHVLTEQDMKDGWILACQALPLTPRVRVKYPS